MMSSFSDLLTWLSRTNGGLCWHNTFLVLFLAHEVALLALLPDIGYPLLSRQLKYGFLFLEYLVLLLAC